MFSKTTIGRKLVGGYSIVSVLVLIVVGVAYNGLQTSRSNQQALYNDALAPVGYLGNAHTALYQYRSNALIFMGVPEIRTTAGEAISSNVATLEKNIDSFRATKLDPDAKDALADFSRGWGRYHELVNGYVEAARSSKGDASQVLKRGATSMATGEAAQARKVADESLTKLQDLSFRSAKALQADSDNSTNHAVSLMFFATLLAIAVAISMGFHVSRSITEPLRQMIQALCNLGVGRLDTRLRFKRTDEIGELGKAMDAFAHDLQNIVVGTLKQIGDGDLSAEIQSKDEYDEIAPALKATIDTVRGLNDGMQRMSREHNAGDIDAVIAVDQFKGEFRNMAQGINDMVAAHIHAKKTVMACVAEFGKGNFDAPLEQFPGKKAFINDTIEELRRNLKAVTVVANYVDRISKGDIPAPITASYNGYFETIKNNLNTCIEAVNKLVVDSKMLSRAAVDGKLATRADASAHQGEFRTIVEGVNDTLNSVIDPVDEATGVLERIANKDLTARMEGDYKGDHAKLKNVLNVAVENLDQSLEQVSVGASQVVSASGQINAGSQTLSQGSSQQASSLEEISSSLQEMASMTRQNSANAKEANSMAGEARGVTERGMESMQQLSEAMDRIKTSSDETAKIIKTIDEIAFQTNLLALNAAVEAARAGDAGKGFAVVAEEVRSLAMRSAEAAKNTANMIEAAVRNAESGVKFNEEVNKNLREINVQATKVTEVMAEIAAASEQQSLGIQQVTTAVEQMDQITQQNAANSEESASASEELTSQAEEMLNMVAGFRISSSSASAIRTPSTRYAPALPKLPAARIKNGHGNGNGFGHAHTKTNGKISIPLPDDDDAAVLESF